MFKHFLNNTQKPFFKRFGKIGLVNNNQDKENKQIINKLGY